MSTNIALTNTKMLQKKHAKKRKLKKGSAFSASQDNAFPGPAVGIHNSLGAIINANWVGGDQLCGYIFICNSRTKLDCFVYRVFGMSTARMDTVSKIRPNTMLFLFDVEMKVLYGLYRAVSNGSLALEPHAFQGKFPAQVRFEIVRDCLPLPETALKQAIQENYTGGAKFKQELSNEQVNRLVSMFRPIDMPPPSRHPFMPPSPHSFSDATPGPRITKYPSVYEQRFLRQMHPQDPYPRHVPPQFAASPNTHITLPPINLRGAVPPVRKSSSTLTAAQWAAVAAAADHPKNLNSEPAPPSGASEVMAPNFISSTASVESQPANEAHNNQIYPNPYHAMPAPVYASEPNPTYWTSAAATSVYPYQDHTATQVVTALSHDPMAQASSAQWGATMTQVASASSHDPMTQAVILPGQQHAVAASSAQLGALTTQVVTASNHDPMAQAAVEPSSAQWGAPTAGAWTQQYYDPNQPQLSGTSELGAHYAQATYPASDPAAAAAAAYWSQHQAYAYASYYQTLPVASDQGANTTAVEAADPALAYWTSAAPVTQEHPSSHQTQHMVSTDPGARSDPAYWATMASAYASQDHYIPTQPAEGAAMGVNYVPNQ